MDSERQSKYEELYNIKLSEFYHFVTDVMADFGYSLYRNVKEIDNRRRVESWVHSSKDEQKAIVWIEVVKPNDKLDPFLTTDVLRAMNDENIVRLFFFTNGNIEAEDRDVLEGNNHFIFATEEIVETLIAIDAKRSVKVIKKRKTVKLPSATVLIKNFFKNHEIKKKEIRLKTSATPELLVQYTRLVRRILNEVDKVNDINDIPVETKEKLKKIQFDLLPELVKTPSYVFPKQFAYLNNVLFNLIHIAIIYIGNFTDYESEDDLKQNREILEDLLTKIDSVDDRVLAFKADMMFQAEKTSVKIILTSGLITFISLVLLIVVRFGH
ncbi:MAG: hypothetical protein LBH05_06530 [Deferribacteraceae bacterium]|jgi:hypothetical protein|nr:hypothetical protein [Deferribacteraceae bacterium]